MSGPTASTAAGTRAHGTAASRGRAALGTTALLAALVAAGCTGGTKPVGGHAVPPSAHPGASPATTSGSGTTTPAGTSAPAPTTGPVSPPAPTSPAAPAGGPVPAGFVPASVTAVTASTFWVLGNAPCPQAPCTSVVRSTDGGAHFVGIPAPPAPLVTDNMPGGAQPSDAVNGLRFADDLDGWAFGPALYATHDGGGHWHPVPMPGQVLDLAAADGQVWVLGGTCRPNQGCTGFWLQRSAVGHDRFSRVALPVALTGPAPTPSLTLQGSAVFLLVNSLSTGDRYHSTLLASTDGGRRFSLRQAPCTVDLGGSLSAAPGNLWAVCATGMMSQVWRSIDDGTSFSSVPTPVLTPNSAVVAAAGPAGAVLAVTGPHLYVTGDGGRTWAQATIPTAPDSTGGGTYFVGMSDPSVGFALASSFRTGTTAATTALLRTTDGGRSWTALSF